MSSANRLNTMRPWSVRQCMRRAFLTLAPRRLVFDRFPGHRAVFLTFDDGPHAEFTPAVLDVLRSCEAKATFFVLGKNCEEHPELVRRIIDEGHSVGNHTYLHPDPAAIDLRQLQREINSTNEVLNRIVGSRTKLFRPPYGRITIGCLAAVYRQAQTSVLWNVDTKDFKFDSRADLSRWIDSYIPRDGDVILMHDIHKNASHLVSDLLGKLADSGLAADSIPCGIKK